MGMSQSLLRTKLAFLLALGLASQAFAGEITDVTGHTIKIAEPVPRIAAAGPPAEVLLYSFAPEAMVGWVHAPRPDVAAYLSPQVRTLPEIGGVTAKGQDPEISEILAKKPQLILDFGDTDARYIALAEKVRDKTGLPYVLLSASVAKTPETLRALGKLTGRAARGEELARYAEDVLNRVQKTVATAKPVKVYVAGSADGTVTTSADSGFNDIYALAGMKNVISAPTANAAEVQAGDPDLILAIDSRFREYAKGPGWSDLRAVKAGRIITPPRAPWGWTDHPPSVNRLLGLLWLTSALYGAPDANQLRADTKSFFKLFYHVDLTEEQITALLNPS